MSSDASAMETTPTPADAPAADAAAPAAPLSPLRLKKRKRDPAAAAESAPPSSSQAAANGAAGASAAASAAASSNVSGRTSPAVGAAPILLGAMGAEAIREALATQHPTPFIQQFQKDHGCGDASVESSLCFLDLFAPRRAPMYASLVSELNEKLTAKIRDGHIDKDKQLLLLEQSFPYIRVDELRSVPISLLQAQLASTGRIPSKYQKALVASPTALIDSLPLPLRRCMMEAEPQRLFCQHPQWTRMLAAYANDAARIEAYRQLLPLEHMAPAARRIRQAATTATAGQGNGASSGNASASSVALHGLLEWIGTSHKLYDHMCTQLRELVLTAEREGRPSDAQAWRSLRVDLIMCLHEQQHEAKHAAATSATAKPAHLASHIDHLHTWVWCLDAGVREKGHISERLIEKLVGAPAQTPPPAPPAANGAAAAAAAAATAAAAAHPGVPGFLSTLKSKYVTAHTLADLGLLSSHPFIVTTLLHSVLSALAQSVEQEITPREHPQLKPLMQMLHLALASCADLERTEPPSPLQLPYGAESDELLAEFCPLIAELIIYAQLGEMEELSPKLTEFASHSRVACFIFLYYLMSRLQAGDLLQSSALLSCLPSMQWQGQALWGGESAQGDQQPLHSVLHTLTVLIVSIKHSMKTDDKFRTAVFSSCFVPLARLSPMAHRECLRLLLQCVDCLTVDESSSHLQQLQQHGSRPESPVNAKSETPAAATATAEASAPVPLTVTSNVGAQIRSLYHQFQGAHPQLLKPRK